MSAVRKVVRGIRLILGALDPFNPGSLVPFVRRRALLVLNFRVVTPVFSCLTRLIYVLRSWGQHGRCHLQLDDCVLPATVEIIVFHGTRFHVPLGPCKSNSPDHFSRS
jgi:hypothetical protein